VSTCRSRTDCRLCGSTELITVGKLAPTPPANDFRTADRLGETQPKYPLELRLCGKCFHLQLGHVVDPTLLFADYVYVSGTSPSFVRHFQSYADIVWNMVDGQEGDLAVDIGSNDGTLLKAFADLGARVSGIDPAKRIAEAASAAGIPTRAAFFSMETAQDILDSEGRAKIITANNVCAHIDDLEAVILAVRYLLAPDGLFAFEVSYLRDVLEQTLFDTIYHEHLDYHSIAPLEGFLGRLGLKLIHAERVSSHGGSVRLYAAHSDSGRHPTKALQALIASEKSAGLFEESTYRKFFDHIARAGAALVTEIKTAREQGRRIAGFGAPAKATTLLHQFELTGDDLAYIVDDSPWKQGLFSPGLNIPIVAVEHLEEEPVDDLLLLAWNFAEPIIANNRAFLTAGKRFIVPLPKLNVVTENDI